MKIYPYLILSLVTAASANAYNFNGKQLVISPKEVQGAQSYTGENVDDPRAKHLSTDWAFQLQFSIDLDYVIKTRDGTLTHYPRTYHLNSKDLNVGLGQTRNHFSDEQNIVVDFDQLKSDLQEKLCGKNCDVQINEIAGVDGFVSESGSMQAHRHLKSEAIENLLSHGSERLEIENKLLPAEHYYFGMKMINPNKMVQR